jgi:hypothetical protein
VGHGPRRNDASRHVVRFIVPGAPASLSHDSPGGGGFAAAASDIIIYLPDETQKSSFPPSLPQAREGQEGDPQPDFATRG